MANLVSPKKNQPEYLKENQDILMDVDLEKFKLEVALGIRPKIADGTMCMDQDRKIYTFVEGHWCETKLG